VEDKGPNWSPVVRQEFKVETAQFRSEDGNHRTVVMQLLCFRGLSHFFKPVPNMFPRFA